MSVLAERGAGGNIHHFDGYRLFATKMGDEFGKTQSPHFILSVFGTTAKT